MYFQLLFCCVYLVKVLCFWWFFFLLLSKVPFGEILGLDAIEWKTNLTLHCVCGINSECYVFQEKNQRQIEILLCCITIAELDLLVPVTVEGNRHLEMIPLISRQLTMTFIRQTLSFFSFFSLPPFFLVNYHLSKNTYFSEAKYIEK